jgi:uncharacterized protein YecT (DUF1311 family)
MPKRLACILFFNAFVGILAAPASAAELVCGNSANTVEETKCMSAQLDRSDRKLSDYIAAAKVKIGKAEDPVKPKLDDAQAAWLNYRTAHCGEVYSYWSAGTYRYRASLQCMLDLTRERTHDIWAAYLTYQDSTPAVLPEP